jgi:hypothetical protein
LRHHGRAEPDHSQPDLVVWARIVTLLVLRGSACPACSAVRVGGSCIANDYRGRDRYDHPVPDGRTRVTSAAIPVLLHRGATLVAAGRVALGVTALAWPSVPARPWVGAAADDLAARVFGRALGARDLALGLGALAVLQRPAAGPGEMGSARAWIAAGALSDALDVVASVASWRELPRVGRWLVAASAGGAALVGAAAALAVQPDGG